MERKKIEEKSGMNFSPASMEKVTRYACRKQRINVLGAHSVNAHKRTLQKIPGFTPATDFWRKPGNVLQENAAMVKM